MGILRKQKDDVRSSEKLIEDFNIKLKELNWEGVESCKYDFYEIRSGKCQHAETAGHNDNIICENPNCSDYNRYYKL
jgi:hypothetical protein